MEIKAKVTVMATTSKFCRGTRMGALSRDAIDDGGRHVANRKQQISNYLLLKL
jgi:hypothetical protein